MKKIFTLILSTIVLFSNAQSLSSSVVATAGDYFSSTSGSVEWTLGEIVTETYGQSNGYITQGFQQSAGIIITSLDETFNEHLFIYPNPTIDVLFIESTEMGDLVIEVFNLQGRKIINRDDIYNDSTSNRRRIEMQSLLPAVYFLRIFNLTTGKYYNHKITKL